MPITAWPGVWASSQTVSRRRITKISIVRVERPPNFVVWVVMKNAMPMLRNQSMSRAIMRGIRVDSEPGPSLGRPMASPG